MNITSRMFLILAGLALCSAAPESFNRIANGNLATPGQFPYMVSLQQLGDKQSEPSRGHRCAGALVTLRKVVTTAYCLHDYSTGVPQLLNKSQYRVFAGSNALNDDSSADFVRPIQNFTIHPNFSGLPALNNDIGVITLAVAFPNRVVTPLSLPSSSFRPADMATCNVAGWGSLNNSSEISINLRFASKYIYNQNLCTSTHSTAPVSKNILSSMICAVFHNPQSSNCFGDFGNPLVCGNTFTGILSTSNNCSNSNYPEVYTRMSNYTSWVRRVSGAPSLINPGIFALLLISFIASLF